MPSRAAANEKMMKSEKGVLTGALKCDMLLKHVECITTKQSIHSHLHSFIRRSKTLNVWYAGVCVNDLVDSYAIHFFKFSLWRVQPLAI